MKKNKWSIEFQPDSGMYQACLNARRIADYFTHQEALDGLSDCKRAESNRKARERNQAMAEAYRSCGMVKVRGALGGTYWE